MYVCVPALTSASRIPKQRSDFEFLHKDVSWDADAQAEADVVPMALGSSKGLCPCSRPKDFQRRLAGNAARASGSVGVPVSGCAVSCLLPPCTAAERLSD